MIRVFALVLLATGVAAQAQTDADVTVAKSGPSNAAANSNVTFNITISNVSDNDALGVTLDDNITGGWTFVSLDTSAAPGFTCSDPGPGNAGPVTCNAATLTGGASASFTLVLHIPTGTAGGTVLTNIANVSATNDPNAENNSSAAVVTVGTPTNADVSITKSGPSSAPPNTDVTYNITVTNFGPGSATNVSWTDTLPSGVPAAPQMTFVDFQRTSGPSFNCGSPSSTTTCTIATLAAGTAATFTFTGHIPSGVAANTEYTNDATVTSDDDPNSENNTASTTLIVSSADVGVTKSGPATAVAGGAAYSYTITLSNGGPDPASNATFTDNLPAGLTFVSLAQNTGPFALCNTPPVGSNGPVACTIALLAKGSSAQFTLTVQPVSSIPNGTQITNTATASATSADTNPANDSSSVSTTVSAQADLSITKIGPASVVAGNPISYTINVSNNGPSDATTVSWSDTLPAGTTFVSETQNTGPTFTCTTGATVSCSIASLAAGATASFAITAQVSPATTSALNNTAVITSTTVDTIPGNNTSTVPTTVTANADLGITKTGPAFATAGTSISYSIAVANTGPSTATSVTWNDVLPAGLTFVSLTQNTGPSFTCTTGATISCSLASFAPGGTATFSIAAQVSPSAVNGSSISNTANITSATPDGNPANNSSTSTAVVAANADLSVTKTGPSTTPSNTTVTYVVAVANGGPSTAANVTLTDDVPANMTFAGESQTSGPLFSCTAPPVGGTGTITCTIASLASGASASFQFVFNVPSGTAAGTTTSNTASVSSTTPDATPTNNSATVTTSVGVSIPALSPAALAMLAAMIAAIALLAQRR